MDKFVVRKRKSENWAEDSERVSSATSDQRHTSCTAKLGKSKKIRTYLESYLAYGFTWTGDEQQPTPECIICGYKMSNESMVPSKLSRHFTSKHSHLFNKSTDYFKGLLKSTDRQSSTFVKKIAISDKAQEASYIVAELIAKEMKPHTIGESLILPACKAIVRTMFGPEAETEIRKIPLSNDTVSRRINDMSVNIEECVGNILSSEETFFALQVDESTDISGKCQLLCFVRFVYSGQIKEQFLCCKELKGTATGKDIFNAVNDYLTTLNVSWRSCVGLCTDGAPSMVGSSKGFVSLAKKENPDIITTHCFLHREALVAKTLDSELKTVLDDAVKMVNYIKSRPLKSRLFHKLCEQMGSNFQNLILHTEVRWLSRGRVLNRLCELTDELHEFFMREHKTEFCSALEDKEWQIKLSYLSDIFGILNQVNSGMQGRNENILSSTDKMKALNDKIKLYIRKVEEGHLEMFPNTSKIYNRASHIVPLIIDHLNSLDMRMHHYFPDLEVSRYDWVRNPFMAPHESIPEYELGFNEEEQLLELQNDRTAQLMFSRTSLEEFWIAQKANYPNIGKKAIVVLLQFSTSYLCEIGFSNLCSIKNKKRERLQSLEEEMRVCLSTIRPDISKICAMHQSQVSH